MITGNEKIRFLIAGTLITAIDFGVYYFLFHFLSFSLSKAISFTCAGMAGYAINKYWTFKHGQSSYAEIGRYVFINFLALGVNVSINQSILGLWPGAVWPALGLATAVTSLFTFIYFKWWVFRT